MRASYRLSAPHLGPLASWYVTNRIDTRVPTARRVNAISVPETSSRRAMYFRAASGRHCHAATTINAEHAEFAEQALCFRRRQQGATRRRFVAIAAAVRQSVSTRRPWSGSRRRLHRCPGPTSPDTSVARRSSVRRRSSTRPDLSAGLDRCCCVDSPCANKKQKERQIGRRRTIWLGALVKTRRPGGDYE